MYIDQALNDLYQQVLARDKRIAELEAELQRLREESGRIYVMKDLEIARLRRVNEELLAALEEAKAEVENARSVLKTDQRIEQALRDSRADLLAALERCGRLFDLLDEQENAFFGERVDEVERTIRAAITAHQGEPCPECGGSKYVDAEPSGLVKCPACNGSGIAAVHQGEAVRPSPWTEPGNYIETPEDEFDDFKDVGRAHQGEGT